MGKKIERPGVREGYDQWSSTYDQMPNPLVALDRRHTIPLLKPDRRERILDAGCGTGANLPALVRAGSQVMGVDLSHGMLQVARRAVPTVPLVQADLDAQLPVQRGAFDAVLCALVGEHLPRPAHFFGQAHEALAPGGRLVFSVFHPACAAAGIEANFERGDVEYRLGAIRHSVDDYLNALCDAGFQGVQLQEFTGDEALASAVPAARKYVGQPLLLAVRAVKPSRAQ
jgi:SAM-dependent methyltransferase